MPLLIDHINFKGCFLVFNTVLLFFHEKCCRSIFVFYINKSAPNFAKSICYVISACFDTDIYVIFMKLKKSSVKCLYLIFSSLVYTAVTSLVGYE